MRKLSVVLAALILPLLAGGAAAAEMTAKVRVAGGGTYDYVVVGEMAAATDGYDYGYDGLAPGGSLNETWISSVLAHPEWGAVKAEFRSDIRSLAREQIWEAAVTTNLAAGTQLLVSLDPASQVPAEYRLVATDLATGQTADLRAGSLAITVADGAAAHLVRLRAVNTALPKPQETLTVNRSGSGTVAPDSGTIQWAGDVGTAQYNRGAQVLLTATAAAGYVFAGWTGCDAAAGPQCTVTMSGPRTVGAPFDPCGYTVAPTSVRVLARGATGTVKVTTSAAGCSWTAVSSVPWIKVTAGAVGAGNGTVSYSVARNTTRRSRTGTITVAGKTVTVWQSR